MIEINLKNVARIKGLTIQQMEKIKNDLTLDNPKYAQANKFSKFTVTKIPKYLTYYKTINHNTIEVPIGYKVPFSCDNISDERKEFKVSYPKFLFTLRDIQQEAVDSYLKTSSEYPLKSVICLNTGIGKTISALFLSRELKQRTLVVVHKVNLISGWKKDIEQVFGGKIEVGLIQSKNRKVGKEITLATVQTLNKLPPKDLDVLKAMFGFVILDEGHHCSASSYDLLQQFNCKYRLCLTATPERNDGLTKVIHFNYGDFAYKSDVERVNLENDILPVQVVVRNFREEINPLVVDRGNRVYDIYEPEKHKGMKTKNINDIPYMQRPTIQYVHMDKLVMENEEFSQMLIKDVVEQFKKGRSCVVFFKQIQTCNKYFDLIAKHIPETHMLLMTGKVKESIDTLIELAEDPKIRVTIATYSLVSEGTNVKAWEVAFLASSINNGVGVEQTTGRIRRSKEGKINPVLVYDYRLTNTFMLSNHGHTRDLRYRKLGYSYATKKSLFTRGFKN